MSAIFAACELPAQIVGAAPLGHKLILKSQHLALQLHDPPLQRHELTNSSGSRSVLRRLLLAQHTGEDGCGASPSWRVRHQIGFAEQAPILVARELVLLQELVKVHDERGRHDGRTLHHCCMGRR